MIDLALQLIKHYKRELLEVFFIYLK